MGHAGAWWGPSLVYCLSLFLYVGSKYAPRCPHAPALARAGPAGAADGGDENLRLHPGVPPSEEIRDDAPLFLGSNEVSQTLTYGCHDCSGSLSLRGVSGYLSLCNTRGVFCLEMSENSFQIIFRHFQAKNTSMFVEAESVPALLSEIGINARMFGTDVSRSLKFGCDNYPGCIDVMIQGTISSPIRLEVLFA